MPTWWLLYAIGLSLVGVLVLVEILVPEEGVRASSRSPGSSWESGSWTS